MRENVKAKHRTASRKSFFWAELCLRIVKTKDMRRPNSRVDLWKNLVIIEASKPEIALRKAQALGKMTAKHSSVGMVWNSDPAKMQFLGITSMGRIHGELKDGVEITWNSQICSLSRSTRFVSPPAELLERLKGEGR